MNAASIVSVITVYGIVFLSLLALCAEKGEHPFRRAHRCFRRLPAWEKTLLALFVGAWIAFASVKEGTNGVSQVEGDTNTVTQTEGNTNDWENVDGTNIVGQTDGEGTNGTGSVPGPLMMGFFGRPNLAPGTTPAITEDDIARMWRISSTTAAGRLAAPTANAVTNADWRDYGGMSDVRRIKPDGWRFPYGDKATDGLTVFQNGDFRPNVKTHFFPRLFDANLSLLPRLNWGLLPDGGESVFWHEHTSSNSLVLTWHNALYNREASCPTNFQAELFADGRFDYRYPDRTVRYAPVFPFDWDGDGLENSVDPDPQTANPIDAHGANDEWLLIVCSNVFESVGGTVSFRADVNTDAYYFVDVCAERGPAPVYFVSDRDSRLGSPVVVAQGGETNRVPLLIGVEYVVTSTVPISVAFNDIGFAQVKQNDERTYVVKWPLAFHFAEGTPGLYTVSAVPCDPGVVYVWDSTPDGDEPGGRVPLMSAPAPSECSCWSGSGATVLFSCSDNCGCGGDCHATGTASMENASFAVTGGVCHCSLPDDPHSDPTPSMPDPLVGGLSISFSKDAVIFEDEYRNTEDGPLVPRRSTTTRLTISASGGFYGGSFALTLQNLDKLVSVGGSGSISPPTSKMLAPYETYYATFECEGVEASGEENDVGVYGTFIEAVTWRNETPSAEATVVKLELEAVYDAPENHNQNRHVYGVGEKVKFKVSPKLASVMLKTSKQDSGDGNGAYELFNGNEEINATADRIYTCPISSNYTPPIRVSMGVVEYHPAITLVEPQSVICRGADRDLSVACLPFGQVGGQVMVTTNYIGPMHVSFQGVMVSEIPCTESTLQEYFLSVDYEGERSHTVVAGAGVLSSVKPGNFWTRDLAGRRYAYQNWWRGRMEWSVPIGWHRARQSTGERGQILQPDFERMLDKNSRALLISGGNNTYRQIYSISQDGNASISKHGHILSRSNQCVIVLDGETLQWEHQ